MTENVCYVSLGDSIATGTMTPFANTRSFVFYVRGKLGRMGASPQVFNLAQDGNCSWDLLWKLEHSEPLRRIVARADVITVSIGGNDLMRAMQVPGFTRIDIHKANRGLERFLQNWPRIVERIRSLNRDAQVVVLSLYNPYNDSGHLGRGYYSDRNLCEVTDRLLAQLNDAIAAHAGDDYAVADVYGAFKPFADGRMGRVSCLYQGSQVLRNPHPTPEGQRIIAELVADAIDVHAG